MPTTVVSLDNALKFLNGRAPVLSEGGEYTVFGSNGPLGRSRDFNHESAIILGRVGAYCGSVAISEERFWASDNTIVVKPKANHSLRYWYYRLVTLPLRGFAGGAAQPLLTHGILRGIKAVIQDDPNLQRRIADILSAYDDLIENNRRRMALLEDAARQLYREWFVRLRFPGHEHTRVTNGVPDGWEKTNAISAMDVLSGGTPKTSVPDYWDGDIPF
jgi:type I restriction enzyme, S subunit